VSLQIADSCEGQLLKIKENKQKEKRKETNKGALQHYDKIIIS
jgi:hypothetical protein